MRTGVNVPAFTILSTGIFEMKELILIYGSRNSQEIPLQSYKELSVYLSNYLIVLNYLFIFL